MKGRETMKIVVIGGTGLIGSKTVAILRQGGHEVVAASPQSGIDTVTGQGLKEVMVGAQVAIDLANSPSFEDKAVLEFFQTSGRNLLAAEATAGVGHHVARVADRLQIAGDDCVERRSLRSGDLDDAASRRRDGHLGDESSDVVRRDGLEQTGRKPDHVSVHT